MATKATARPKDKKAEPASNLLVIPPPDFKKVEFHIRGTSPLMICRFSEKAMAAIRAQQEAGSAAKSRKVREPKNFDQLYNDAKHISTEGWEGISAAAFRNAAISACKTCGVVMTRAKLAFSVIADGYDRVDEQPLVKLINYEVEQNIAPTRLATGVMDLRCRPMYRPWEAKLRIQFDAGMFRVEDLGNLLMRVGCQVGIGEGRPDSRNSAGIGYGLFELI